MISRKLWVVLMLLMLPSFSPALAEEPLKDPKAFKVLESARNFLRSHKQLVMHTEGTFEEVLLNAQKLQYANNGSVYLHRPNKMRINVKGDQKDQEYYYNGKSITLYGKRVGYYATIDNAPANVRTAFDYAAEKFSLDTPFTDFFTRDLLKVAKEQANSASYIGVSTVRGVECHHLAFRHDDIDWQLWVQTGKQAFPRKLVITETWVTGAPQFTVEMVKWETNRKLKDSLFNFVPPKNAQKIEFLPAIGLPK